MGDRITTEIRDHLFLIGLNRAEKRNAFDRRMLIELAEAYTAYEANANLWCALVFAHGEHFTAGLDLADVGPAVKAGSELFPSSCVDPLDLREPRRAKPVVIAVQGWCLTIGTELALACDVVIAARDVRMGQIEVKRGIMPFGGATLRLPRIAGWGNAMRYLLTGDLIDAEEALRIGLAQEIVDTDALMDRALELAGRIAAQAPLANREILKSARLAIEMGDDAATAVLLDQARGLMGTADAREGLMSFVERRDARFTGR